MGRTIHNDTTLNPVIYTIGLGGTGSAGESIDTVFLQRLANDPQSPIFDATRPQGRMVYAADASQLEAAYNTIASEILRLAQ
jgi:hypothetical protein